ncbi:hypothetical protein F4780DRAFT_770958 [Xylariomycetidae sp. FL0641]|nr:hypothetical protein F4780DRAFT_770958 [Xylariomycetidae sp. FL0641]
MAASPNAAAGRIRVAIIGGGITGVILALGLQRRGVEYVVYERAPAFTEIGAGIGFSPNAERALAVVDPRVYDTYKAVASSNPEADYFTWIDGHRTNAVGARLLIGVDAFQGGRRSDFLDAWSELIPEDRVVFGKELVTIAQPEEGGVRLAFKDGSTAEFDVAIGCDGIRSRVRQLILGEANPASYAVYTHKYCFRALVPMAPARAAVGEPRTRNRFMYLGPGAHAMTYPVAQGQLLNLLLVLSDAAPWRGGGEGGRHTGTGRKAEAAAAFAGWHPAVRALVDLLPDDDEATLDKWAVFDMAGRAAAPAYHAGAVALAGDAAHAAGPHLGSGAGFGIEDALVLATVLAAADSRAQRDGGRSGGDGGGSDDKARLCRDALAAYNSVRYDRAQWLAPATREACALFHWQDAEVGSDFEKFQPRIASLFHAIWDNDIEEMVKVAEREFESVVAGQPRAHL